MLHLLPGFIACLLAILTFRKLDPFSRFVAVQVCLACLVELAGWQLKIHGHRNTALYNCYMPVEFALLFLATCIQFTDKVRLRLMAVLAFYLLCWVTEVYLYSIDKFAVKTYVTGAIILLVCYFFVLYHAEWNRNSLLNQSRLWFSIGVILFFGCNIPFFSMYDYIVQTSDEYQMRLLSNLMKVFSHFRYLCTAVGFILVFRAARRIKYKSIA